MIRSIAKKLVYSGLSVSGATRRSIRRLIRDDKIVVLNLHSINPKSNPYWPSLHPRLFEELLQFLSANFRVCRFAELHEAKQGKPIAVLSFDDGYRDFLEFALPLLDKYDIPANMNVIPECARTGRPIWNVQLYDFLNSADAPTIVSLPVKGFEGRLADNSGSAKMRYGIELSRYLKNRPQSERREILSEIEPALRGAEKRTEMMSASEIKAISDRVEIGVHSYSHESMGFESDGFFQNDFERCSEYFAEELELPLKIYAFPNGSHRNEQIDFLKSRGVESVLLVNEKAAPRLGGVYTRITTYGDSPAEIRMRSLGY
jgi:peptidoglycan/xylan/chitin deacetylase (PgdA/CDA1 family)